MKNINFIDKYGTFRIKNPENYSGLYLPLAGEMGLKSSITPTLGGDSKTSQNTFLLEPVSIENLHNNKGTRNFWCRIVGKGFWSVCGSSAQQEADRFTGNQDESELEAGLMWQKLHRASKIYGLEADTTSFVTLDGSMEVMLVEITNKTEEDMEIVPIGAIPIYGRSADNIRDHRHVTSLLHRIETTQYGIEVTPVLSFDERGHQKNDISYFVYGSSGNGESPESFYPTVEQFIGEGGSFLNPEAVRTDKKGCCAGERFQGKEAVGAIKFANRVIKPRETVSYIMLSGLTEKENDIEAITGRYQSAFEVKEELNIVKRHWIDKVNIDFETGNTDEDNYLKWICFQPILRRIFSHMAVMYANALYKQGFIKEGYKVLKTLLDTAMDFDRSRMYPGVPEYFDNDGRGLYSYLTGAASWYMLTMITSVYGVHGELGDLVIEPALMPQQYNEKGDAKVSLEFAGHGFDITIHNSDRIAPEYAQIKRALCDGVKVETVTENSVRIPKHAIEILSTDKCHTVEIYIE